MEIAPRQEKVDRDWVPFDVSLAGLLGAPPGLREDVAAIERRVQSRRVGRRGRTWRRRLAAGVEQELQTVVIGKLGLRNWLPLSDGSVRA